MDGRYKKKLHAIVLTDKADVVAHVAGFWRFYDFMQI